MKTDERKPRHAAALAVAVWLVAGVWTGWAAQTLSIGEHAALPAGDVRVPVTMADATSVAATAFIVNFEAELLALSNVTTGGLGAAFALECKVEEGRVAVALVRDEALASGSGTLVYLHFTVNPGAVAGMTTPLAIADRAASGQYAVDLAWRQSISHSNGVVRIVSLTEDANGDGLPDWWEEQYFEGPTAANAALDSDGDGMTNGQEFIAGTHPLDGASVLSVTSVAAEPAGFKLRFPTVAGVMYRVLRSEDLSSWAAVGADIAGTGETVEVVDPEMAGTGARYYRVLVVR